MKAWFEEARFDIFAECDVYCEDGSYLYVENEPFNYNGDYTCCVYQQGRNLDGTMFYIRGEHCPADNNYIMSLDKAPWNVARDIIERDLAELQAYEYDNGNVENSEIIEDARCSLMEDAKEDEIFIFW